MKPTINPVSLYRIALCLLLLAVVALVTANDRLRQQNGLLRAALALQGSAVRDANERAEQATQRAESAERALWFLQRPLAPGRVNIRPMESTDAAVVENEPGTGRRYPVSQPPLPGMR